MAIRGQRGATASLVLHPSAEQIATGISRCLLLAIAWAGDVFRATGVDYANRRDLVTGEGSRKAGARWNAKGAFRALYGSLDLKAALEEVLSFHRGQGLPDARALPLVFVALRVEVQRILD